MNITDENCVIFPVDRQIAHYINIRTLFSIIIIDKNYLLRQNS